jgi:hypothetical protein
MHHVGSVAIQPFRWLEWWKVDLVVRIPRGFDCSPNRRAISSKVGYDNRHETPLLSTTCGPCSVTQALCLHWQLFSGTYELRFFQDDSFENSVLFACLQVILERYVPIMVESVPEQVEHTLMSWALLIIAEAEADSPCSASAISKGVEYDHHIRVDGILRRAKASSIIDHT